MHPRSIATVLVFVTLSALSVSAENCPLVTNWEQQVQLESDVKISVVDYAATVNYKHVAGATTGLVKVISTSSIPDIKFTDGHLWITTRECKDYASSASRLLTFGTSVFAMMFSRAAPLAVSLFLTSMMSGVMADSDTAICQDVMELEITIPEGWQAATTVSSLNTDHYLAATKDTVRWGYYDLDAPNMLKMQSGETVTVEVITHHSGHDYAKMIRGDKNVEEIFYWEKGDTLMEKTVPKPPGSGVHIITGPIEIEGAEPGDVLQVDILALDPRPHPVTGKTYGTNSQKFAGYQFRAGHPDGTPYTREGGHEAITVFEFEKTEDGAFAWANPVYMYRFPKVIDAAGDERLIDNMPCVVIPHEKNYGAGLTDLDGSDVEYPTGFDGTETPDGIEYLDADLDWKVPLRPHLGTLGVMPANTDNYRNGAPSNEGANSIPPSKFGGNVDDWRVGKGGTMYYTVEVAGGKLFAGDTHAAQGDSELAGTAMETSMTAKFRVTLHKKSALPAIVQDLNFPLLETAREYVVHGFAYADYLEELDTPSEIFAEGASLDMAMMDCFQKTRKFLMNGFDLTEEESIALMATGVDFGITQVVDGNWGVHADIEKWIFEPEGEYTPYDYSYTSPRPQRRSKPLLKSARRSMLDSVGVTAAPEEAAMLLLRRVTAKAECKACAAATPELHQLATKWLDAKLRVAMDMIKNAPSPHVRKAFENHMAKTAHKAHK